MGIRFILMVNKQGQTRLAQYYEYLTIQERRALEGEIVRKCLARNELQEKEHDFVLYWEASRSFSMQTVKGRLLFCSSQELASSNAQPPLRIALAIWGRPFIPTLWNQSFYGGTK